MANDPPFLNRDQVVAEIDSRWVLLTPDGMVINLTDPAAQSILDQHQSLLRLTKLVTEKGQAHRQSTSLKLMRQLEWADYEPASDRGHLRLYPAGTLIHNLIRDWHEQILVQEMNAAEVRTPFFYDWSRQDIRGQAGTFHDRLYYVTPYTKEQEFVLRFGGDLGQFSLLKDARISYRNLPLRVFEYAESFRYQRSGELRGLEKARSFSLFDIHSICADSPQAWTEFAAWYYLHANISSEWNIDYSLDFTIVDTFFEQHKALLLPLLRYSGRPALVELISKRKHYWLLKYHFHDEQTHKYFNVQLDQENSSLYGIEYNGPDGQRHGCTICHIALGSIQRWMILALEIALKHEEPVLPLWLAPTQLRLLPVSQGQVEQVMRIARDLAQRKIRVDVDDRHKTLSWRIQQAQMGWVPYVVVIGEREIQDGVWSVNNRGQGTRLLSPEQLVVEIQQGMQGKPFRPYNPMQVSARPQYC